MARNFCLENEPDSDVASSMTLASIAKAVWQGNCVLGEQLINQSAFAAKHIAICNGVLSMINLAEFEEHMCNHRKISLEKQRNETNMQSNSSNKNKTRNKANSAAIDRLCALWTPFRKSLVCPASARLIVMVTIC